MNIAKKTNFYVVLIAAIMVFHDLPAYAVPANSDADVQLTDSVGVQKFTISDSTPNQIASINSDALFLLGEDGQSGRIRLYSEQGALDFTTTFQTGTQTQNITYTLPNDDGAAGQVLSTDGSGILSWTAVAGSGDITSIGDVLSGAAFDGTQGNVLQFEGTTADGFETSLTSVDATADNTITLPDSSGVLLLSPSAVNTANSISGINNGFVFEGSTADANELTLLTPDVSSDVTITLPSVTGTLLASSASLTQGSVVFAGVGGVISEDNANLFWDDATNRLGLGDATPASALTVGNGDLFQVNSSGNIIKIRNVDYSWPAVQGAVSSVLTNDGAGNLSWAAAGAGDITSIGDVTSGAAFDGTQGNSLQFEGTTTDAFETTLTAQDPGADFTITIPAITGTIVTTGDNGSITSTMILDDTITASDLNSTLTFSDGDFINLSSINPGSSTEGLILPQGTNVSSADAEGQISWDSDDNQLVIGIGGSQVIVATSSTAFIQNGNIFGAATVLGTNDNNSLSFETNSTTRMTIAAAGDISMTNNLTVTGDAAVNGGDITSTAGTLNINAAGTVNIQDNLTADSLTLDTAGITLQNGETINNTTNNTFTFATNAAGTPDSIQILPNTAGAGSFTGTMTSDNLTADRAFTFPDNDGTVLLHSIISGDATVNSAGALTIAANSVDGSNISIAGESTGDIIYYDGTDYVRLAVGSAGQVLTVAAGLPSWAAAAAGDITAVGDVASGAAFNGTQGTTLTFDDADGDQTFLYDTTNNKFVASDNLSILATGVDISATNGSITFLGLGSGSDENLTLDLDTTSNQVALSSSTGVTTISLTGLDLAVGGGDVTTAQATATLFNANATTLNIGGAATTVSLGAATGTTTVNNNLSAAKSLTVGEETTFTPSSSSLAAGATLSPSARTLIKVSGSGAAVTLSAATSISAGTADGQILILKGNDATNTVTINDNSNVQLDGNQAFTLGLGDTLQLVYDATDAEWYEVSRSDN